MTNALENLRHDALQRRIKGVVGGNRIHWAAKDIAAISDYIMATPEETIRAAPAAPKLEDVPRKADRFAEADVALKSDVQPADLNFLFRVSSNQVDLANDVIQPAGIDAASSIKIRLF